MPASDKRPQTRLRILQVNVGKRYDCHKAALETAFQARADVVLIQEPAATPRIQRTQTHPAFRIFIPQDTWQDRPRTMTYVRKDNNLTVSQPSFNLSSDLLHITISGPGFPPLHIWNVYNAPARSDRPREGLSHLLQQRTPRNALVAGDFNLRHPAWDPSAERDLPDGILLSDWADSQGLHLLNPPNVPTHDKKGVLDLAFSNNATATARVATDLHSSSDHETLWIQVDATIPPPPYQAAFASPQTPGAQTSSCNC